jgi:tetraacyldisaccharide 4'-kinase
LIQVKRADAVILTKTDQSDNIIKLKDNLKKWAKGIPVFTVNFVPVGVRAQGEKALFPVEVLRHKKIWAFTGIGNPQSFHKTLTSLESKILGFVSFPDHYWYKPRDLQKLMSGGEEMGAEALVTTEKDAVRLGGMTSGNIPLWTVCLTAGFTRDEQNEFEEFLRRKLGWV